MTRESIGFFFASLDFHLGYGLDPADAIVMASSDYARVYGPNSDQDRSKLSLAAEVVLEHGNERKCNDEEQDPEPTP